MLIIPDVSHPEVYAPAAAIIVKSGCFDSVCMNYESCVCCCALSTSPLCASGGFFSVLISINHFISADESFPLRPKPGRRNWFSPQ